MIKTLHLQTNLNLSCGVTRTISEIIKNISPEFEQHLISLGGNGIERFHEFNFNPIILNNNSSFISSIKTLGFILNYCKGNKIDVIHSHHRYFDFLSFFISKFIKVKTITSVHSKVSDKKNLSYKSDVLIACSNSIKSYLVNYFEIEEKRIKVIYNMVNQNEVKITESKNTLIDKYLIPQPKFIIGFIGRFDFMEKGVDILLHSFKQFQNKDYKIHLVLLGNGIDKKNIEEFVAENNLFVTVIDEKLNVFDFIQLFDVLILPSRIEPFGLSIIEAALMKKVVIASDIDGISEIIEHEKNGLLFQSENVDDLTQQIIKVYKDNTLASSLSANLYNKVLENYTADKIIPQYEKTYLDLFNE